MNLKIQDDDLGEDDSTLSENPKKCQKIQFSKNCTFDERKVNDF